MKKFFILFTAMAATFLMTADLYSANDTNPDSDKYCVYFWTGVCYKNTTGTACYLVDSNCDWFNVPDIPEEQPE